MPEQKSNGTTPHIPSDIEIIDAVGRLLDERQPKDYSIQLNRDSFRREDDWLYLVVHPSKEDVRASEYTRRLEEIENEIAKKLGVQVLLVPTLQD